MKMILPRLFPVAAFFLIHVFTASAEVLLYPGPSEETLAQLSNLRASDRYTVRVNGQPLFVYASTNRTGPDPRTGINIPKGRIEEAHFCYFSFKDEPVTIEVERISGGKLKRATLHPARFGIVPELKDGKAAFTLDQPRKIVLKTAEDELHPLVILADEPDTDIPSGPDVTYFGPGFHDIGLQYEVKDGETLYIAGGAIVRGSIRKPREKGPLEHFTLRGRGILYSGDYEFIGLRGGWGRGITAWEGGLDHGRIEGVLLVDSLHWNTGFRNSHTVFDNIKILSFHGNTDGIRVGRNSVARNSFVMCNDDALLPEGHNYPDGMSMLIEDCIVWHHSWGNPFKIINLSEAGGTGVQNLVYRNIDIIETGREGVYVFVSPDTGGHAFREEQSPTINVLFENIYVEQAESVFNLRPPGSSTLRNIIFRNVHLPKANGIIAGWNAASQIEGITFDGLFVDGQRVTDLQAAGIEVGPFVQDLHLQ